MSVNITYQGSKPAAPAVLAGAQCHWASSASKSKLHIHRLFCHMQGVKDYRATSTTTGLPSSIDVCMVKSAACRASCSHGGAEACGAYLIQHILQDSSKVPC
jgi:hypothetical protein